MTGLDDAMRWMKGWRERRRTTFPSGNASPNCKQPRTGWGADAFAGRMVRATAGEFIQRI